MNCLILGEKPSDNAKPDVKPKITGSDVITGSTGSTNQHPALTGSSGATNEDPEPHRIRIMSWNIDGLDTNNIKTRTNSVCDTILK